MWTAVWGKQGIAAEIAEERPCMAVDDDRLVCAGILIAIGSAVDTLLTNRHESNQPSNNHYN